MDDKYDDDEILRPGSPPYFYDNLVKGSRLSIEKLERMLGIRQKEKPQDFEWACRRLQSDIHDHTELTVVIRADGLEVLTDDQASSYNDRLFQHGLRVMFRRHAKNLEVDVANLAEDRRMTHDRNLNRNGRLLGALQSEQRKIRLESQPPKQLKGKPGKGKQEPVN